MVQYKDVKVPGLPRDTVLSRDELNVVLDLEEETVRCGEFDRIFPNAGTAYQYYGYLEERRYWNALYCAWLGTAPKTQKLILDNSENALAM